MSTTTTTRANLPALKQIREDAFRRTLPFRTIGGISRIIDVDFHDLHPHLPVIEVHGKPGSSGSPVFASRDGTFIGLIILNHCGKNYVLPTDFIVRYMSEHKIDANGLRNTLKRKGVEDCDLTSQSTSQSAGEVKTLPVMHQRETKMVKYSNDLPDDDTTSKRKMRKDDSCFLDIDVGHFREFRRPWLGFEVANPCTAQSGFLGQLIRKFPSFSTRVLVVKVGDDVKGIVKVTIKCNHDSLAESVVIEVVQGSSSLDLIDGLVMEDLYI